jgi:hypothetical protein
MIYYFLFSAVCLIVFIFHNWYDGWDLRMSDVVAMAFISVFPVMNLLMLCAVLFDIIKWFIERNVGSVLLKGQK